MGGSRDKNKGGFYVFGRENVLFIFGAFSRFQPSPGVRQEELGIDLIL
jgi:hypothetical protein